jgi:glycosyltransferase involved in cell wall biosynthesis
VNIVWRGPISDPSGYAEGGRAWVRGLAAEGASVRLEPQVWHYREAISEAEREWFLDLTQTELPEVDASIQNTFARMLDPYAPGRLRIARTMFETDRIPADWVGRCNQMDEVWVPTEHNRRAFVESGVAPDVVHVIPEPFELDRFLAPASAYPLPDVHGTVVLASLDWTLRKGWDLLLAAWCEAFRPDDDVTLVLKAWSTRGLTAAEIQEEAIAHIRALGHDPAHIPDMVILDQLLSSAEMPELYAACSAVCSPTRGEGWGRPLTEAMASGLPVIATVWSGPSAFVDDTVGWPLGYDVVPVSREAVEEVPQFAGHRWAEPRLHDLIAALRDLHERPDEARTRGGAARERAREFDHRRVARLALDRLAELAPRRRGGTASVRPGVVLSGPVLREHSLSGVNRELARAILESGAFDLSLVDTEGATLAVESDPSLFPLAGPLKDLLPSDPDVTVSHQYPPVFSRPATGAFAMMLHWEFGPAPIDWVRAIEANVDELWVATEHVRRGFLESGLDPERVVRVPLGVDARRFHPGVEPLDLGPAVTGFRFLFVGGLLWRKGVDILLEAYVRAFTRADDVTLVVKDFSTTGPYRPQGAMQERLHQIVADPRAPRLAHFTGVLPESDMPRLYAACDSLVHPYRGEGYGLPIAEAMACGLPVVVPDKGACRDFATPDTAILVPSADIELPDYEVGGLNLGAHPRMVEIAVNDLAAAMRRVFDARDDADAIGARASAHMHANHTWAHTGEVVEQRLTALAAIRSATLTSV